MVDRVKIFLTSSLITVQNVVVVSHTSASRLEISPERGVLMHSE